MDSAVDFNTERRVHIGLTVSDLSKMVAFYEELFGQKPTKLRDGYAKFEVEEPPVNFTLNEQPGFRPTFGASDHFGIQVKSRSSIAAMTERVNQAGLQTSTETGVVCCYAEQDKLWLTDPEGRKWEVFVVLDANKEEHSPRPVVEQDADSACCAPTCCT